MMASLNREEFFFWNMRDDYWSRWQSFETIGIRAIYLLTILGHSLACRLGEIIDQVFASTHQRHLKSRSTIHTR